MIEPRRIAFDLNGNAVGIKPHEAKITSAGIGPPRLNQRLVVGEDLMNFLPVVPGANGIARAIFQDVTTQNQKDMRMFL